MTEFLTQTNADKINFVRRNRIVSGMSDACILIESAAHGGGLITCDISQAYGRDVFAFPGRVGDATARVATTSSEATEQAHHQCRRLYQGHDGRMMPR